MAENILLTFLSDVKVFGGKVSETVYENVEGAAVHTTNESAARYLLQNEGALSKIFILASKKIRGEIGNGFSETHLEYFKNRMANFVPEIESCINAETICNYDEDNGGAENLKSVAEMAERIQKYSSGKEIILHADLTGGMRHVNMMMLDVIRLLEYSGVKIGRLIYSNFTTKRVEEVKNIYNLFQLISGVEEFVNFGSVEALKKYYAGLEQSENLKKLTDAMEFFAEAIKLCHYGQFIEAIENLHDSINDFETGNANVQDILMERLIGKIHEKYKLLITTRGKDDLKIIRWCLEHGYLQQTLTLYTERVPEYLGANFVIVDEDLKEKLERKLDKDERNFYFYLLTVYLGDDESVKAAISSISKVIEKINQKYFKLIREDALISMQQNTFSYIAWREKIFDGVTLPPLIGRNDLFKDENKIRLQLETLDKIYQEPQLLLNLSSAELKPVAKIIEFAKPKFEPADDEFKLRKKFFAAIKTLTNDKIREFFQPLKIDSRIMRLRYMLREEIFHVKISEEKFLSIMKKYFIIKDERNRSNHARTDKSEFENAKELEKFMKGGLDEIES